jgi:hypothetical protein
VEPSRTIENNRTSQPQRFIEAFLKAICLLEIGSTEIYTEAAPFQQKNLHGTRTASDPAYVNTAGLAAHWNPTRLCDPSQNGRFSLWPHRHNEIAGLPVRSQCLPSASVNEIGPSTRSGPFGRTVIFTACSDISATHSLFER